MEVRWTGKSPSWQQLERLNSAVHPHSDGLSLNYTGTTHTYSRQRLPPCFLSSLILWNSWRKFILNKHTQKVSQGGKIYLQISHSAVTIFLLMQSLGTGRQAKNLLFYWCVYISAAFQRLCLIVSDHLPYEFDMLYSLSLFICVLLL